MMADDDVIELHPHGSRRRRARDTEPMTLTISSEATVLRALARTERSLESVAQSVTTMSGSVSWLSVVVTRLAIAVYVGVAMVAVLLAWTVLR